MGFDLVSRVRLYKVLERIGCSPKQFDGSPSTPSETNRGVKQGCVQASNLFGIYFAAMLRHAFGGFREVCGDFRLNISLKKTNIMGINTQHPPNIHISNYQLEAVNEFTYLGSVVTNDLSLDTEIDRTGSASATFAELAKRVWENTKLTLTTKILVYKVSILSTLLYGCATWNLYSRQKKRLNIYNLRNQWKMLKIKWYDHITNNEALQQTSIPSIYTLLCQQCLRWLGHVCRMEDGRIPKDLLHGELNQGSRPRG
ncbi:uncharacterized protein LOC143033583 [Oratosquilla oratoria]|uniref:uncharacterized protein LOC143033583 n=1 Tax=Oratosquilla oratoria TaxID=337810 RepID=UPI003F772C15